ncbi:hypothetical protein OPT61_g6344 [Boeremia exigua]|uniref:Uncharacterized protein n=1 Tax=Boeremia exigua TaxID=749465 RepID=A0ACC2I728_9PLEO|nr:hypothetical protein OPT61_g6344 [Boeremia exigua]
MAAQAAAYPQNALLKQNDHHLSHGPGPSASRYLHAEANGQALSQNESSSWNGSQQGMELTVRWQNNILTKTEVLQPEARNIDAWQHLDPQAVTKSGESLGHDKKRLSTPTSPKRVAGHGEPKLQRQTGTVERNAEKADILEESANELDPRHFERGKYAQKLCERFTGMLSESPHPHRPFLRNSKFNEIHGSDVCTALEKSRKTRISVDDPQNYRRILFVLGLLKLPTKIRKFIKHGVCDADLPLCIVGLWKNTRMLRSRDSLKTNTVKFGWLDAEDFCRRQWVVLPPKFGACKSNAKTDAKTDAKSDTKVVPHYELDSKAAMPFKKTSVIREGSYGEVTQVEIFPDHHSLLNDTNIFALKKLKSNGKMQQNFTAEATILRKLQQKRHEHDHLINLLATFKCNDVFHFVFPWAELDLLGFWRQYPTSVLSADVESWIMRQCVGLIEALCRIHRYDTYSNSILALNPEPTGKRRQSRSETHDGGTARELKSFIGRHGDLKPENILWFPGSPAGDTMNEGILKIADFGSTRFTDKKIRNRTKHNRVPTLATYQSLEHQLKGGNRKAKVKYAVNVMMENLYAHRLCTPRLGKLLDIIKNQMLVVDAKHRAPADIVELQRPASSSLPVPTRGISGRRSSGAIMHDLGDLLHDCVSLDREVEETHEE